MNLLPTKVEMERAFLASDASYDGIFYTGVRTTGVFCLPSCPARKPRSENVEFFASTKQAMFAGYRPCKRCRPTTSGTPEWLRALLEKVDTEAQPYISDEQVRAMGIEPARVRRYFQARFGMTFQAYCRAKRLAAALDSLRQGAAVDDAVFASGYDSHSGFRESFVKLFGTAPGASRDADCIRIDWIDTPLGPMIAGSHSGGICLLEFTDRRMLEMQFTILRRRFGRAIVPGASRYLDQLRSELDRYFKGELRDFSVALEFPGSPFEQRVWNALRAIPYGTTVSYEELAIRVGSPGAQRAVGTANGRNRIAIVIPCHRVVNKSGQLGGYGGGLWRKRRLLELEREQGRATALPSGPTAYLA